MSWPNELYNVYERNYGLPDTVGLLPIAHSTAKAHIEITIDESGNFITAEKIIDKNEATTVIQVTDDSAARTNGIAPHPFADILYYIAGDYSKYCDGKKGQSSEYYDAYIKQLEEWVESPYSHKAAETLLLYLWKGSVIHDLISCGVLISNESGGLQAGVKINEIEQEKAFVRFRINYDSIDVESRTWEDVSLQEAYVKYSLSLPRDEQLCYATGKIVPVTYKHPSKLRHSGDKCKLISSNDDSGFTYRGFFENERQATSVGYEYSQKVHNALRWLINKHGVHVDDLYVVVWESSMREFPRIENIIGSASKFAFDDSFFADTFPSYKNKVENTILGYKNCLDKDSKAIIMGVDSATIGRLSISMYSELDSSEFLENVEKWYSDTAWFYRKSFNQYVFDSFSLRNLITYAFGTERGQFIECDNPKFKSNYMCKLIPCIIEGRKIPKTLIRALVNNASAPHKYSEANWERVLNAACGMIRKEKIEENKEECKMALDENCTDRSYLYGRLLAVADLAESKTYKNTEGRTTNAKRYFEAFSNHPYTTWNIIRQKLNPYLEKLDKENHSGYQEYYARLIDVITNMFDRADFENNSKLDPIYLHAYSCQVRSIRENKTTKEE